MRILKSHPLLRLANSYIIDSPQPSNISYLWNFGSLLAFCLIIQIITGVTLAMHYNPSVLEAFNSVEHIMRDVNNGWLIRYLHANTASAFFFIVYLHMGRGLYYGSYRAPRTLVWTLGVIIFILMIVTAFLGLLHSPKWFKFHNNNNPKNIFNRREKKTFFFYPHNKNEIQATFFYTRAGSFVKVKPIYTISVSQASKRYYSTSNRRGFTVTLPCFLARHDSEQLTNFIAEKQLNPVFIYEDLSNSSVKTRVLNETRNLSGIYLILNKVTLDYYIGSASTGRFHARFSNHLFHFNGSKTVKNAVKKYGLSSFAFMVLELFPEIVNKENNKKLLDLEDFYLKSLLPNYNILTEAGSSFGYKHSEITRIKMKTNYSEQRRMTIGNLNKGKSFSPETIELIRKAALSRTKPTYSEQAIDNMKNKSKALLVYNLDYTVFGEFPSMIEASKSLGCDQKTIRRALQTPKNILRRRWIVKYV